MWAWQVLDNWRESQKSRLCWQTQEVQSWSASPVGSAAAEQGQNRSSASLSCDPELSPFCYKAPRTGPSTQLALRKWQMLLTAADMRASQAHPVFHTGRLFQRPDKTWNSSAELKARGGES